VGRLDEEVVMVGHQTVRETLPTEIRHYGPKDIEKGSPVLIGFIDCLPPIPARGDVIVSPGKLDAQWSCHALTASCLSAIKLDLSPFS
jgi:hypothetical protein